MRTTISLALALLVAAMTVSTAEAFVLIKIREVFAGSTAHPGTRYVMLQMIGADQGDVISHSITFFDATGASLPGFTFPADVANEANQSTILVGTNDVASVFGVTPDFPATPGFSAGGGKVCFDVVDCVSWGNYTSSDTAGVCSNAQPPVCTPAAAGGIPDGKAIRRRIDRGSAAILDFADDTGLGADDCEVVDPDPIPNTTVPTTTTTTSPGSGSTSTTSTTLPCALPGADGARCVLGRLPPSACIDASFPRKVPRLVAAADALLARAQSTTSDRPLRRLLTKAAAKLARSGRVVVKAGANDKLSPACVDAMQTILDEARDRIEAVLPVS